MSSWYWSHTLFENCSLIGERSRAASRSTSSKQYNLNRVTTGYFLLNNILRLHNLYFSSSSSFVFKHTSLAENSSFVSLFVVTGWIKDQVSHNEDFPVEDVWRWKIFWTGNLKIEDNGYYPIKGKISLLMWIKILYLSSDLYIWQFLWTNEICYFICSREYTFFLTGFESWIFWFLCNRVTFGPFTFINRIVNNIPIILFELIECCNNTLGEKKMLLLS